VILLEEELSTLPYEYLREQDFVNQLSRGTFSVLHIDL